MSTQAEIGAAGERIAAQWLAAKGYTTDVDTRQPGSTDITATSGQPNLLVQVKTAVSPSSPADLSADEVRNIKSRAARMGYQAWQAKVSVDANLRLLGEIVWKRLDS